MKKLIAMLVTAVMLLTMASCFAEAPTYDVSGEKPITVVFATANATANIESVYANRFMELVQEYSNGQISFDYTEGGVMGTQIELVEGTMYGSYDMTCTAIDNLQTWVPEVTVSSMSTLIDSYEMAEKVFDGEYGATISQMIRDQADIEVLNYMWCGYRNVCSKKEITTLEDAKNVLLRVPEVKTYIDFAKLTGFSGVTMSWNEAYTSMNSGIIEAVEVPLQNIYEQGFYDLGSYVLMTRHIFNTNSIMASAAFMDGLPEVYQQIIRDAAKQAALEERVACQENEQNYISQLQEKGVTINEWDEASYNQLMETFTAYWQETAQEINDTAVEYLNLILACK